MCQWRGAKTELLDLQRIYVYVHVQIDRELPLIYRADAFFFVFVFNPWGESSHVWSMVLNNALFQVTENTLMNVSCTG